MSKNNNGSGKDNWPHEDDDEDDELFEQAMARMLLQDAQPDMVVTKRTTGRGPENVAKTNREIPFRQPRATTAATGTGTGGAINPDMALALMLGQLMNVLLAAKGPAAPAMYETRSPPGVTSNRTASNSTGRERSQGGTGSTSFALPRPPSISTGTSSSGPNRTVVRQGSGSASRSQTAESATQVNTSEQQCDQVANAFRTSGQTIQRKLEQMNREWREQEERNTQQTIAELERMRRSFTDQMSQLMQSVTGGQATSAPPMPSSSSPSESASDSCPSKSTDNSSNNK